MSRVEYSFLWVKGASSLSLCLPPHTFPPSADACSLYKRLGNLLKATVVADAPPINSIKTKEQAEAIIMPYTAREDSGDKILACFRERERKGLV